MTHLDFLRQLPCLICGDNTTVEAAHIRYAEPKAAKPITGMGTKSGDWAVPLCGACHRAQHKEGERRWWKDRGINPVEIAAYLRLASGDHDAGCQIIESAR